MGQQAVIRRVRVAVSVFFGVLTVAILALWVRSYWLIDDYDSQKLGGRYLHLESLPGHLSVVLAPDKFAAHASRHHPYRLVSRPANDLEIMYGWNIADRWRTLFPTYAYFGVWSSGLTVPHWAFALMFGMAAGVPWITSLGALLSRRFSLRILFAAFTLVAVALWLSVWSVQWEISRLVDYAVRAKCRERFLADHFHSCIVRAHLPWTVAVAASRLSVRNEDSTAVNGGRQSLAICGG